MEVSDQVALLAASRLLRHTPPVLVDGGARTGALFGDLLVALAVQIQIQNQRLLLAEAPARGVSGHQVLEARAGARQRSGRDGAGDVRSRRSGALGAEVEREHR